MHDYSEHLPDVPTLAEAGVKDVEVYSWQAVVAPKGLPVPVRDRGSMRRSSPRCLVVHMTGPDRPRLTHQRIADAT